MKKIILAIGVLGLLSGSATVAFAGYFNNTPIYTCDASINNTLQVGQENDDVYMLQQFLSRAGYLDANPNGYFGPSTKLAVKRFQADNSISATGKVGETTLNILNERLCDSDVRGDTLSDYSYGYSSGITYVDSFDQYAKVISPQVTDPVVYMTPGSTVSNSSSYGYNGYDDAVYSSYSNTNTSVYSQSYSQSAPVIVPATTKTKIQSTNIIYSPSLGYTYGIVPQSGSLSINTPLANTTYHEDDTVYLSWTTKNINANGYIVLLENTVTNQSKPVVSTDANKVSFKLTKELLDSVCVGVCDNSQQGSFRIVVTTPMADIAGKVDTFRAAISPITIKRPYGTLAAVSITGSKSPVDSGEKFKLYVNIPQNITWNADVYSQYVFKIRAICPSSVQVSIAGVACGQDFIMPTNTSNFQQEIPAIILNNTYFRQNVSFELTVTTLNGKMVGTSQVSVVSNAAPFNW